MIQVNESEVSGDFERMSELDLWMETTIGRDVRRSVERNRGVGGWR